MRKEQHVVPASQGGWNLKAAGSKRASKHFDNKIQAVQAGRKVAKNQSAELVVHGRNGRIQYKDSHGRDPFPPRG